MGRESPFTTEMFWPRMKMTEEKEPTTREIDRAVDGRDWLIKEESGGNVTITDSTNLKSFQIM